MFRNWHALLIYLFILDFLNGADYLKTLQRSPYDVVYSGLNKTVIVLSVKPCSLKKAVTITLMRTGTQSYFHSENIQRTMNESTPIRVGTYDVLLDLHENDVSNHLHVTMSWSIFYGNGSQSGFRQSVNTNFEFSPNYCSNRKYSNEGNKLAGKLLGDLNLHNKTELFEKQQNCNQSLRLGSYSTLCYQKNKIVMTISNPCDIPYSVTVMVLQLHGNLEVVKKFTASPHDPIALKVPGTLGGEKRVRLVMETFQMDDYGKIYQLQHVHLGEVYENSLEVSLLIEDAYYTTYSMICPVSTCSKLLPTIYRCNNTIITGPNKQVHSPIEIKLNICAEPLDEARLSLQISGYNDTFQTLLRNSHDFSNAERNSKPFRIGNDKVVTDPSGFLPVGGGNVSLYVDEEKGKNRFHVMVFRHYPKPLDIFPILHVDFFLSRQTTCKTSSRSTTLSKVIIPIVCVVLVLLFIAGAVFWWKKRRADAAGLPYQIELGMDDDDFDERS